MSLYRWLLRIRKHRNLAYAFIFTAFVVLGISAAFFAVGLSVQRSLHKQLDLHVAGFNKVQSNIFGAFDILDEQARGAPCTIPFLDWLRQVAFLPDGIHEFLYVEDEAIMCSANWGRYRQPIELGLPDVISENLDLTIWYDQGLDKIGYAGLKSTFVRRDNFIVLVGEPEPAQEIPDWVVSELVSLPGDSKFTHRSGMAGLFEHRSNDPTSEVRALGPLLKVQGCDDVGLSCISLAAPLAWVMGPTKPVFYIAIVSVLLASAALLALLHVAIENAWAFPVRFQRCLRKQNIICHYQPILSLRGKSIAGIEVLARWKDIDGSLIYPDRFLPVVEQRDLYREFTQAVIKRAFEELSRLPRDMPRLQLHFNMYPKTFEAEVLLDLFAEFRKEPERFKLVVELIESDAMPLEVGRQTVLRLNQAGILTYIDDFGVGFSSIQYLANLGTHGVKLHRSIGLAPKDSLLNQVLKSAVEMIGKTGQMLVVEGVENRERLEELRQTADVALVQGYFIAKPMPIAELAQLFERAQRKSAGKAAA